ncbi:FAD-dependent oxidoreductase [Comamonas badia]|uniref:FAD-dependent oxidoreductase n=1 Tax=Comamonas badia TaxID=265291 RepID=UPI0004A4E405|nr:GMC family oxidoreductase [Comamonas badia]
MIFDFSQSANLPEFDVCVVGAGPAGITLALKMAEIGLHVGLIEAGGMEYGQQSQDVYKIESLGRDLYAESTRLRYFGGTSNHWSGRCRPFVKEDFERAIAGDLPGWPISFDELNRYQPEAMQILDIPENGFATENESFDGGYFEADHFALSPPTRFAEKYKKQLEEHNNVNLYLNCNLIDVRYDRISGGVVQLSAAGYDKQQRAVKAKNYVLAMGGIENSRMLLNSVSLMAVDHINSMTGVGFMEHLNVELGEFVVKDQEIEQDWSVFTTPRLVKEKDVGRGNVSFGVVRQLKSYGRTAKVKTFLKGLVCDLGLDDKIELITRINCPGEGVIGTLLEQFPERSGNRIELSDETDYFGLRRAKLNWQLSERDIKTVKVVAMEAAKAFADSGLGFVKLRDYILRDDVFMPVSPHAHHMGGTRMAADKADGVVDENCKVFGVSNLFIAGSSVFATGGGGNPTMPLIQLTLRLADHLRRIVKA